MHKTLKGKAPQFLIVIAIVSPCFFWWLKVYIVEIFAFYLVPRHMGKTTASIDIVNLINEHILMNMHSFLCL